MAHRFFPGIAQTALLQSGCLAWQPEDDTTFLLLSGGVGRTDPRTGHVSSACVPAFGELGEMYCGGLGEPRRDRE